MENVESMFDDESEPEMTVSRSDILLGVVQDRFPNVSYQTQRLIVEELTRYTDTKNIIDGSFDFERFSAKISMKIFEDRQLDAPNELRFLFKKTKEVIADMNDGDITPSDMKRRMHLLKYMDKRIADMQFCFSTANYDLYPAMQEKMQRLRRKYYRLMELKSLLQISTKSPQEVRRERIEQKLIKEEEQQKEIEKNKQHDDVKGKLYSAVIDKWDDGQDIPNRLKARLGIESFLVYDFALADEMKHQDMINLQTKQQIVDRINQLRGRQSKLFKAKLPQKLVMENIRFDKERYRQLKELQRVKEQG